MAAEKAGREPDRGRYADIFADEAYQHIRALRQNLAELSRTLHSAPDTPDERRPDRPPEGRQPVDEIFRSAHTLKASAAAMGYRAFSGLTDEMENLLYALREGRAATDESLVELLGRCVGSLEDMLLNIVERGAERAERFDEIHAAIAQKLDALTGIAGVTDPTAGTVGSPGGDAGVTDPTANTVGSPGGDAGVTVPTATAAGTSMAAALASLVPVGGEWYEVGVVFTDDCPMKGARAFMICAAISRFAEILASEPDMEAVENGLVDAGITLAVDASGVDEAALRAALGGVADIETFSITRRTSAPAAPAAIRARCEASAPSAVLSDEAADIPPGGPYVRDDFPTGGSYVRVESGRLGRFAAATDALTRRRDALAAALPGKLSVEFAEAFWTLSLAVDGVAAETAGLVTVPASELFELFPGLARELAAKNGKQAELTADGGGAVCDRVLAGELHAPLLHIVRNSIDHGLETPEIRLAAGKPAAGRIALRAYNATDESGREVLVIEAEDDGAGINLRRVREKAVRSGAMSKEAAAALPDAEVLNLVFVPSFSTLDAPTELSGRGVGLDVVKDRLEALGGSVALESREGLGTKLRLSLPTRRGTT